MRKFQCLLFVLKRSYICYYIICMTVPLRTIHDITNIFMYSLAHKSNKREKVGPLHSKFYPVVSY